MKGGGGIVRTVQQCVLTLKEGAPSLSQINTL